MEKGIKLSIIYVYYNTPKELLRSIDSVKKAGKNYSHEIIIVDNNSPKKLPSSLYRKKIQIIHNSVNLGFGSACNVGAKVSRGEFVLFLNPDTVLSKNSVDFLISNFKRRYKAGIVGPKMTNSAGQVNLTISKFYSVSRLIVGNSFLCRVPMIKNLSNNYNPLILNPQKPLEVDVVGGACMLIRKNIFKEVGGFDERFFMYFEEHDLCLRVKRLGYKIIYDPSAKITHLIARSSRNKESIRKIFQKSRYLYAKKHFGYFSAVFVEVALRSLRVRYIVAILIFTLSLILNIYRQESLMLLIGDAARDFLAARDMLMTGTVPLVGIPSSVVWLHQGPISIYGIALAFALFSFNPVGPAILFGFLGAVTSLTVYLLASKMFDFRTGMMAGFLYATAPIVVVNARMPYHTSLVPFFSVLFFSLLYLSLKKNKAWPVLFLSLGFLLQVELSNLVVFGILGILFWVYKIRIPIKQIFVSFILFSVGILPFILYELINGPAYLKFPLWVMNRVRLFFGIGTEGHSNVDLLPGAISTTYQQIAGNISPNYPIFSVIIFTLSLFSLLYFLIKLRKLSLVILGLWVIIPLLAFFLHASPGTAYFSLIYPALAILTSVFFCKITSMNKYFSFLIFVMVLSNIFYLNKNDFYVTNDHIPHPMPPMNYNFGSSWKSYETISRSIVNDSKGKQIQLEGRGSINLFSTGLDPYLFLIWRFGGVVSKSAQVTYVISHESVKIPVNARLVYKGKNGTVFRYE